MQSIINYVKEHIIEIILDIIIIILIAIIFIIICDKSENKEEEGVVEQIAYVQEDKPKNKVKVDIKGAIKKEGVYKVDEDSTINDVIDISGGLKKDAITSNINLAKKVEDEMVIYVSKKSDLKKVNTCQKEELDESDIATSNTYVKDYNNITKNEEIVTEKDNVKETKLVNINTASKEELLTLSGLGESKVLSIISYREKTPFTTIEDIKNVSGIKDNLFNKIKDYITV